MTANTNYLEQIESTAVQWFGPWYRHLSDTKKRRLLQDIYRKADRKKRKRKEVKDVPRLSLREFARGAFEVVEPNRQYVHGWHIDAICEHLEAVSRSEIQHLIINIPPRHMKSLLTAVFWPAWEWTHSPHIRWLYSSYGQGLVVRDSVNCRRVISSNWYQMQWGRAFQLTTDQNQKMRFDNTETGYRIATTIHGTGTGEGGDRIVTDDPLKAEDAYSDIIREGVNLWWDRTMSTRASNPDTAAWVVICQRLHERDLPGYLMKMELEGGTSYEKLILPAEFEPKRRAVTSIGFADPRQEDGELLWKERYTPAQHASLKASIGVESAAQLQQRPSQKAGNIFRQSWWRFWKPANMELPPVRLKNEAGTFTECETIDLPQSFDAQVQSWDAAFRDAVTSSFVVGQVWGVNGANKFLLDQHREQMDIVKTMDAIRRMTELWPYAVTKIIENKANGPAVVQMLRDEIPGLIEYAPKGSKESRANAAAPEVRSGNVILPHPHIAPWVRLFVEELTKFPRFGSDDQVDGLTQFINWWREENANRQNDKTSTVPGQVHDTGDMFT